ncbi:hypothetical protein BJ085DRAFT_36663 [Dimargaris cristalligena]|uniref:Uncharacterized protein n=1 Tax=Dimargaris cristalligena TaxID=215637 RepID=A0A4P9ZX05_9FUNG|nr:hypothetical protein BJ085DRAFT_36663 [Dimargaris cristalligena]|eukprot:RKP37402.1 hypothetical protein BJ085DRAFT_36663 [Dimargaris cristalligena]
MSLPCKRSQLIAEQDYSHDQLPVAKRRLLMNGDSSSSSSSSNNSGSNFNSWLNPTGTQRIRFQTTTYPGSLFDSTNPPRGIAPPSPNHRWEEGDRPLRTQDPEDSLVPQLSQPLRRLSFHSDPPSSMAMLVDSTNSMTAQGPLSSSSSSSSFGVPAVAIPGSNNTMLSPGSIPYPPTASQPQSALLRPGRIGAAPSSLPLPYPAGHNSAVTQQSRRPGQSPVSSPAAPTVPKPRVVRFGFQADCSLCQRRTPNHFVHVMYR